MHSATLDFITNIYLFTDAESIPHVRKPNVKERVNYELWDRQSLFYLTTILCHFSPLVHRVLAVGLVGRSSATSKPTGCGNR